MHHSKFIADKLLEIANADDNTLTPMQVLKLVYISHGWMLGIYGRPLIKEEIAAWRYGPVVPDLYASVRKYKSNPVTDRLFKGKDELTDSESELIQAVYEAYKYYNGVQLSALTHAEETPWYITWDDGKGQNDYISNDLIENHYSLMAKSNEDQQ